MTSVSLTATPAGKGYKATIAFQDGVCISSAENYPSIGDAISAAAMKLLNMPDRLDGLDETANVMLFPSTS
jgi:hypothetical protein